MSFSIIFEHVKRSRISLSKYVLHTFQKSQYIAIKMFYHRDYVPMLLVANKVDLVHIRKITDKMGQELGSSLGVSVL